MIDVIKAEQMLISVHFKVTVLDFYFFRLSVHNSGTEKTLRLLYKYAEIYDYRVSLCQQFN